MKRRYFLFLFILLITFVSRVDAKSTCSDARILELSALANNVNASYQHYVEYSEPYYNDSFAEENFRDSTNKFYVTIYNLPKELNALVVREDSKNAVIVGDKDKASDGVIYVDAGAASMVKTFTITIRSSDSNCLNEALKTINVTTPMFNKFYYRQSCVDNPEFALCQEYTLTDYSSVTDASFNKSLDDYKIQKEEEEKKANSILYRIWSFIVNHKWYFIIPIVIVAIAGVFYYIKRKKSRLV